MNASHIIETPPNAIGAVSVIRVVAEDISQVLDTLDIRPMKPGQIRLVSILGLDEALVARFDSSSLLIMPHGGIGITRAVSNALNEAGIESEDLNDLEHQYPEAQDIHEARMLEALSRATSPLAVDLLLKQPDRWRSLDEDEYQSHERSVNPYLDRLVHPPIVVAVGRANIGKSSLVNALAGDSVAMVSDYAGTTRDHVGVMLNLAGLVVRWVDTPGVDETVQIGDELDLVSPVIGSADLVIHAVDLCCESDPNSNDLDPRLQSMVGQTPILRVGVRSDLETEPVHGTPRVDLCCSSKTSEGIAELANAIKESLIPEERLSSTDPWRYWR